MNGRARHEQARGRRQRRITALDHHRGVASAGGAPVGRARQEPVECFPIERQQVLREGILPSRIERAPTVLFIGPEL